jgi:Family of unknown function (DUF6636)
VRRLALVLCLVALATVVIAGCDDDDGTTETVTTTATETTAGTSADATAEGTATATGTAASEQALAQAASGGNHGPRYFETPSSNIGCYVDRNAARCDIRERSWSPPPEPKSCIKIGLDYGQGLVVGKHRAEFICAGDTALGGEATLGYGQSTRRGPMVCLSQERGMTCRNSATGHGFFLARERYRIF